ncbi:hypothetical protein N9E07_07585 [Planktomarina temperata]|nr:hypothetical protein [Planktomarina temperata]
MKIFIFKGGLGNQLFQLVELKKRLESSTSSNYWIDNSSKYSSDKYHREFLISEFLPRLFILPPFLSSLLWLIFRIIDLLGKDHKRKFVVDGYFHSLDNVIVIEKVLDDLMIGSPHEQDKSHQGDALKKTVLIHARDFTEGGRFGGENLREEYFVKELQTVMSDWRENVVIDITSDNVNIALKLKSIFKQRFAADVNVISQNCPLELIRSFSRYDAFIGSNSTLSVWIALVLERGGAEIIMPNIQINTKEGKWDPSIYCKQSWLNND